MNRPRRPLPFLSWHDLVFDLSFAIAAFGLIWAGFRVFA